MATDNSTQETAARELHFTATAGLYQLSPTASSLWLRDHLSARLDQLAAMLTVVRGDGFDVFSNWSDQIQHNYLWSCSMIAEECRELAEHIDVYRSNGNEEAVNHG